MKKEFLEPTIEIFYFTEDVITASLSGGDNDEDAGNMGIW